MSLEGHVGHSVVWRTSASFRPAVFCADMSVEIPCSAFLHGEIAPLKRAHVGSVRLVVLVFIVYCADVSLQSEKVLVAAIAEDAIVEALILREARVATVPRDVGHLFSAVGTVEFGGLHAVCFGHEVGSHLFVVKCQSAAPRHGALHAFYVVVLHPVLFKLLLCSAHEVTEVTPE